MGVFICVPVFNDWENANLLIENFVSTRYENVNLLVIDNGSNQSSEMVTHRISQFERVSTMRISVNKGFGGAIQEASRTCQADWLVWMPGNMKVLPSEMTEFLSVVNHANSDTFVKGHRINRPPIDRLKTLIASFAQTLVAGKWMFDTGGTPSAVHRSGPLWHEIQCAPSDYTFDSYMLFAAKRLKLKIQRPKVPYHQRLIGRSHWQSGFTAEVSLMKILALSIIKWRLGNCRAGGGGSNG
jgi:hypothetical protein